MVTKYIEKVDYLTLRGRDMPFAEGVGWNSERFQVAFSFHGCNCKTHLYTDKENTTRDTLPVLLLPLPKPRNIRNLLRKVTLSP